MNEEDLNRLRKSAKDDFDYFSNSNKDARERWVVAEFISLIKLVFNDYELISSEQSSKVDVYFRDAKFQIKEITDPNIRRGKFYKDIYSSYCSLKEDSSLDEVSLVGEVRDIPPLVRMYDLILETVNRLASDKYVKDKISLDLLIYVTRTRAALIQEDEVNSNDFSRMGWRSVSCVNSKQAIVLFSSQDGPSFMSKILGKVMEKSL